MILFDFIRAKHNLVLKLSVAVIFAMIIARLQPEIEVKGHKVDEFDAVWPYQDLIAETAFCLLKDSASLSSEIKRIKSAVPYFFIVNEDAARRKMGSFLSVAAEDKRYGSYKRFLDTLLAAGLTDDSKDLADSSRILIIDNGSAEERFFGSLFTVKEAAALLKKEFDGTSGLTPEDILQFTAVTCTLDEKKTSLETEQRLASVSVYELSLKKGDLIVRKGEPLTVRSRKVINAYFENLNNGSGFSWIRFIAGSILFTVIMFLLLLYLAFFRKNIFGQNKQVIFLYLMLLSSAIAASLFYRFGLIMESLPFCLVPILARAFFDGRTALFTHLLAVLSVSFFMADKLQFILLQMLAGIGTLLAVAEMRKRQQLFLSALLILILYSLTFFSYQTYTGNLKYALKLSAYLPFVISSGLILLSFPLIFMTEKIFGFISDFRLLELCDLNQPLLRKLSQDVPGTFQHSLQVANLAEEVVYIIGGNTLLVRTGALYHDIGKMYNPKYFTENQSGGYSPHMEMQPAESAGIIIDHVIKGIELAKSHGLPEQVIDFIRTHHGTTTTGYFLALFKKDRTVSDKEENQFRYPGPIPFSKETAVVMLADAVEAASRSLRKYDVLSINDLVDQIIDYKISQHQLINSDITFKDITLIRKVFKKRLMNIYHVRIEYPSWN